MMWFVPIINCDSVFPFWHRCNAKPAAGYCISGYHYSITGIVLVKPMVDGAPWIGEPDLGRSQQWLKPSSTFLVFERGVWGAARGDRM